MESRSKPSTISDPNGRAAWRDEIGRLHREDGPSYEERDSEGRLIAQQYRIHGDLHRDEDKPALMRIYSAPVAPGNTGEMKEVMLMEWCRNGLTHRENGPAVVISDMAGKTLLEEYYKEGLLHCETGPAIKSAAGEEFYLDGKRTTKQSVSRRYLESQSRNTEQTPSSAIAGKPGAEKEAEDMDKKAQMRESIMDWKNKKTRRKATP